MTDQRLELARLIVALDDAERYETRLRGQFDNVRFPSAPAIRVTHSYKRDGGDASRKGQFEIQLTEREIALLMEARLTEAANKVVEIRSQIDGFGSLLN